MGRVIGAALIATLLMAGCADSVPVTTSLSVLSQAQTDFNGRDVVVSGTLRSFDAPEHYWIENDSFDRVELVGVDDPAPWVGRTVEVCGTFFYDSETGRRIQVEELNPSP